MTSLRDLRRAWKVKKGDKGDSLSPGTHQSGDAGTAEERAALARARQRAEQAERDREFDEYIDGLIHEASWFSHEVNMVVLDMAWGTETPEQVLKLRDRYEGIEDKTYAASYWGEFLAACRVARVDQDERYYHVDPEAGERRYLGDESP